MSYAISPIERTFDRPPPHMHAHWAWFLVIGHEVDHRGQIS